MRIACSGKKAFAIVGNTLQTPLRAFVRTVRQPAALQSIDVTCKIIVRGLDEI